MEAGPGTEVYAATIATLGALRIRATAVGQDTTFGRVIRMVEEAEGRRGGVQRLADRFSAYYLPVVALIAAGTYVFSRDIMAAVAVMVVACSCAFALAMPVAILASIGAAAKRGLPIKGGRYIEALEKADMVLLDKTGTLTLGRTRITDVVCLNGMTEDELLVLAASAEGHSEHPLVGAVRRRAREHELLIEDPDAFEAVPGHGIRARVEGHEVVVGSARLAGAAARAEAARPLHAAGKTLLFVEVDGEAAGVLAAADAQRTEVPAALERLRSLGIALGAAGTDVAIEAAHVALMRDDWRLVPELFRITRHTILRPVLSLSLDYYRLDYY